MEENDGSGICAKLIFLVLLVSLGLAAGIVFFELGGIKSLSGFGQFGNVETKIDTPVAQQEYPSAIVDEDFIDADIEPSPIQTGFYFQSFLNCMICLLTV